MMNDEFFMKEALKEAKKAYELNEVPIGAVMVRNNEIIARGFNKRNFKKNPLYHAEIEVINKSSEIVGDWRLEDCTLFVTIEPCPMCAGAIVQARIPRVVFGAANKKAGCAGSILNVLSEPLFNHQSDITQGVLQEECSHLMSNFFKKFRNKK